MDEIAWEHLADGRNARFKRSKMDYRFETLAMLNLAIAKLTTVSVISGNFDGVTAVFEPSLSVLLTFDTRYEWLGMYQPGYPHEEVQVASHSFPTLCLRKAIWQTQYESERFHKAINKRAYIKQAGGIESHIVFLTDEMYTELQILSVQLEQMIRKGIDISTSTRDKKSWDSIEVKLNKELSFSLSYSSNVNGNEELERWVTKWHHLFTHVDYSGGLLPLDGCFISHSYPLEERLEMFSDR